MLNFFTFELKVKEFSIEHFLLKKMCILSCYYSYNCSVFGRENTGRKEKQRRNLVEAQVVLKFSIYLNGFRWSLNSLSTFDILMIPLSILMLHRF